jgi:hypothetical protein
MKNPVSQDCILPSNLPFHLATEYAEWHQEKLDVVRLLSEMSDKHLESLAVEDHVPATPQTAWHYTTGMNFTSIVFGENLRPNEYAVDRLTKKPVLWFSTNQMWEASAANGAFWRKDEISAMSMAESMELCCGLFRFGYPSKLLQNWRQLHVGPRFRNKNGWVKARQFNFFRQGANSDEWMGTLDKISVSDLLVEYWDGDKWVCIQRPSATSCRFSENQLREAA